MYLVVGLGNVGKGYKKNRHNVGFFVLDSWVEKDEWMKKDQFEGNVAFGSVGEEDVIYLKPSTMMNLSGRSVKALCNQYDIPPEKVIVIYDELDLPLGEIKVSFDRGSAGHNGIKSIEKELGTRAFHRIRVGISPVWFGKMRRPKGKRAGKFVLKDFGWGQSKKIAEVVGEIERALRTIVS